MSSIKSWKGVCDEFAEKLLLIKPGDFPIVGGNFKSIGDLITFLKVPEKDVKDLLSINFLLICGFPTEQQTMQLCMVSRHSYLTDKNSGSSDITTSIFFLYIELNNLELNNLSISDPRIRMVEINENILGERLSSLPASTFYDLFNPINVVKLKTMIANDIF